MKRQPLSFHLPSFLSVMQQLIVQDIHYATSRNYYTPLYNIPHLDIIHLIIIYALYDHEKADSLFDYYSREKPEEAWTDKSEFH